MAREGMKPCPFCGSKNISTGTALIAIGPFNNVIECDDCRMYFKPPAESWDDCIKLWNHRAGEVE